MTLITYQYRSDCRRDFIHYQEVVESVVDWIVNVEKLRSVEHRLEYVLLYSIELTDEDVAKLKELGTIEGLN